MKAVILAAGIASRLRPLTDHTPKCLLKVGEKNILALTIDNVVSNGISELVIVTGYLENQIRDFVAVHYPGLAVEYVYNNRYASTNNIYSLWLAKDFVQEDQMLLMDSDIVFEKNVISKLISSGHDNCLALKKHPVNEEEIKVKVDSHGMVLEIGKEVKPSEAIGESIGIEKFGVKSVSRLFGILERKILLEKNVNLFYEAAFQDMIDQDEQIFVVDTSDCMCMEIDTASDLAAANKLVLNYH